MKPQNEWILDPEINMLIIEDLFNRQFWMIMKEIFERDINELVNVKDIAIGDRNEAYYSHISLIDNYIEETPKYGYEYIFYDRPLTQKTWRIVL